ncbi:ArsR/SmtB family transcription factor [Endozoicomonas sp.]|uniref:ArsR/SmtB family transcription factor n=1 Tax=Endozoicomonas sp. TaxID=1892382 RepID=UPI002887AF8D|nr:metalloregulator ArsR/SmtB family transcription factor [Endozoicomonas sp.]
MSCSFFLMPECLKNLIGLHEAEEKELAAYAKAMGHPARVRLLRILAGGVCLGSDLVDQIGLAQSTVSEHLRVLRAAGLVHAEVQHPRTCFSLRPEALVRMRELLNDF